MRSVNERRRLSRLPRRSVGGVQQTNDATNDLVWMVTHCLQLVNDLHILGGILVALKAGGLLKGKWNWIFVPFFIGSIVALATQALIFWRASSLKLHRNTALSQYGTSTVLGNNERRNVIHDDALPLLRRGIVITGVSVPVLIVWIAAQARALESVRLKNKNRIISSRRGQQAVACILALQTCALLSSLILKGRRLEETAASEIISAIDEENQQLLNKCCRVRPSGALSATFQILIWIFLIGIEIHLASQTNSVNLMFSSNKDTWAFLMFPLWIAGILFFISLALVLKRYLYRRYRLEKRQIICIFLYMLSTLCLGFSAFTSLGTPFASRSARRLWRSHCNKEYLCQSAPAFVAAIAIAAAGIAFHLALTQNALQICKSRGHCTPLPLAKTREGFWAPSGAGESFWFLLGSFERTVPERRSLLCCGDSRCDDNYRSTEDDVISSNGEKSRSSLCTEKQNGSSTKTSSALPIFNKTDSATTYDASLNSYDNDTKQSLPPAPQPSFSSDDEQRRSLLYAPPRFARRNR
uniref:Transmembrane protein n=1 Tax=Aureoumbra lagunensis TaxID=44058 RepID=A0A7S3K3G5_9STRA|mmetsp:Transcript_16780/g.25225  ORF Transcript_16780/g.25225 Transcript_16780/m.25225 type:complete len:526 (-) Transcript_16780:268-1845(-)